MHTFKHIHDTLAVVSHSQPSAFATFGCFYLGGVQYLLYVPVFRRVFPTAGSFSEKTVVGKLKDKQGMKEVRRGKREKGEILEVWWLFG